MVGGGSERRRGVRVNKRKENLLLEKSSRVRRGRPTVGAFIAKEARLKYCSFPKKSNVFA